MRQKQKTADCENKTAMKIEFAILVLKRAALLSLLLTLDLQPSTLFAQGTAFTYQGRLNDGTNPASGIYDLRFTIYDSTNLPGVAIAGPLTNSATGVTNGFFTVALDFGSGPFTNGASRWLEIGVRTNGSGAFAVLAPRQQLTPTPYAIYAEGASAAGLNGTIPSLNLGGTYGNAVNFNNGANDFDGTFTGQFFGSVFTGGLFTGTFLGSGSGLGDVWHTAGNLGTSPPVNFLGTTDNQPLEVRVNNQRALRLEPANDINVGSVPNVIGGHSDNSVTTNIGGSVIGGGGGSGLANSIGSTEGVIAGGFLNHIEGGNAHASAIGGGFDNVIEFAAPRAVIAGGHANRIGTNSEGSAIGGGEGNEIGTIVVESAIAGGTGNTIGTSYSFVGAGLGNTLQPQARFSVLGGGETNIILTGADHSVLGGGSGNTNGAPYATVPGGFDNYAAGQYSFAAGHQAKALHNGAFVWADSTAADFASGGNDQFLVRANGGLFFANGAAGVNLDQFNLNNGDINYGLRFGTGTGEGIASKRTGGGNQYGLDFYTQFNPRMSIAQNGNVGIATNTPLALLHIAGSDIAATSVRIDNGGLIVAGLIRSGVETNTSELPSPTGLVVRRINSIVQTAGQVVARTDELTLERDGNPGGFLIRYPALPGNTTIACMGINSAGTQVNFYNALANPGAPGTVQIYTDGQNIVHFECTFGITYLSGHHLTRVTLSRFGSDNFWSGELISTYNQ
jgi:hypothetical protein